MKTARVSRPGRLDSGRHGRTSPRKREERTMGTFKAWVVEKNEGGRASPSAISTRPT